MSTNGGVEATQLTLQLASGGMLAIEDTDLVLQEPNPVSDKKSKGDRNGYQTIPLYNVLWAEVVEANFIIEYALLSDKSKFQVEKWMLPINSADEQPESSPKTFANLLLSHAYGEAQQRRRAYILINPNAGPGNGVKRWENDVKPLFDAARMEIDVVFLKRGGEAQELVESMDIDKYDTVIPCSGDGTPHEVFNGLARRPDAKLALSKIAVGHIPCGSGNAMSCNLYGSHKPSYAALAIVKGIVTPLDLVSITQGDTRIISFLSQSLGIVAEGDLGTEHLRWMGSARFDYGVISRVFRKKVYPCDIAVQLEVEKPQVKEHYKRHASVPSLRMAAAEQADADEGNGLPKLKYGTVKDDLPAGWKLVPYDKVGTVYCGNMAYMAPDVHFFPAAMAADGCMDLITMNSDIPALKALQAFLSVDSNKFFDSPYVHYQKISAYRIIPRNQKDGYISIDGEKVPFEPFQAEVHQGLGRVISKRGMFEAEGPANWDKVTISERLHAVTYVSMKVGTLAILAIAATAQAGAVASESSPDSNRLPSAFDETPSQDFGLDVSAVPEKGPSGPKAEEVIPKCAIACMESYVQKHTRCKIADYKCICNHHEVRDCDALTCFINRCGFTKARNKVYPAVKAFCKHYGKLLGSTM